VILYIQWSESHGVVTSVPSKQVSGTPLRWTPRFSIDMEEVLRIWMYWLQSEDYEETALGVEPDEANGEGKN
jgi:hypothetical protein